MAADNSKILAIDELNTYLKSSESTVDKLAEDQIPGQKIHHDHDRFPRNAIDRWLEHGSINPDKTRGAGR